MTALDDYLMALKSAALGSAGSLPAAEREQICEAARRLTLEHRAELGLPPALDALVRAVAERPREADVRAALTAGRSEDEVFEIVTAAALGAALARAEAGLTALGRRR